MSEDGKVVSIDGGRVPELVVRPAVVEFLEMYLERARAGEIVGVTIAAVHHDFLSSWGATGVAGSYGVIGALGMAQRHHMEICDDVK